MRWLPVILLSLLVAATCAAPAAGQALNLQWRTIDAGGGASSSGVTAVQGTIGQPDAGAPIGTPSYAVIGGFWRGVREVRNRLIFADGFATGDSSAWSSTTMVVATATETAAREPHIAGAVPAARSDPPRTTPEGPSGG